MIESENDDSQTAALGYLTEAHELAPHRPDILYERGELYHRMGNLDAALHDKRLALQLKGSDVDFPVLKQYYDVRKTKDHFFAILNIYLAFDHSISIFDETIKHTYTA